MPGSDRPRLRRPAFVALACLVAVFALLQLVPYGHDHSTPPTTKQASLGPAGGRIADGACMDCHSNKTTWPWYADIAPASFLVVNDVTGGREHLNLSRWDTPQPDLAEVEEAIDGGGMPPVQYKLIHGSARLSDSERRTLIAGFRALYASDPPPAGGGG